jgi:hypothetical protein
LVSAFAASPFAQANASCPLNCTVREEAYHAVLTNQPGRESGSRLLLDPSDFAPTAITPRGVTRSCEAKLQYNGHDLKFTVYLWSASNDLEIENNGATTAAFYDGDTVRMYYGAAGLRINCWR